MIGAKKQGLRPAKQSDGEVLVREFPGSTRSSEIDIGEKFRCIVGGDGNGDGVGIREKIGGFLEARGSEVEVAKVMPDEAGFIVEGSGLDGRRWNTGDIAGEGEDIGSDVAELSEVGRERRRRRVEFGIEVGEVDVGTVTKLKKTVFFFSFFFPRFFFFSFNFELKKKKKVKRHFSVESNGNH